MANQFSQMSVLEINIAVATRLGYTIEPMNGDYVAVLNPEGLYLRTLRYHDATINDVWGLLFKTGFLPDYARRIEAAIDLAKEARLIITVEGSNWAVARKPIDFEFVKNTSLPRAICEAWLLWKAGEK